MTDMTEELERLKTTCLAQEVEIARLQAGFDELKQWILDNEYRDMMYQGNMSAYMIESEYLIEEINRITGFKE